MARSERHWLMKSEPGAYSIDDLERERRAEWDGIRNYQARNIMRDDMKVGDPVLFYHSNARPPGVVGLARVASEPYPDPTQFDPDSRYFDPKSEPDAPRWILVDVEHVETFPRMVPLPELRADPALAGMMLLQKGSRLSIQPVSAPHFRRILKLAGARTRRG